MTGPDVANLQDALQHLLFKGGITIGDPTRVQEYSRALLVDRGQQTFGPTTYKLVRLFQAERHLPVNGEVDQATASALNTQLGLEEGELRIYQVEGRVSVASSVSVGGLRVVIVDKGVGGDAPLTETTTDLAGVYVATFASDKLQVRGKTQPDLQARVFKEQTLLGASAVRYNAGEQVTLDVVLAEKAESGPAGGARGADCRSAACTSKASWLTSRRLTSSRTSPTWRTRPAGTRARSPWPPWPISSVRAAPPARPSRPSRSSSSTPCSGLDCPPTRRCSI